MTTATSPEETRANPQTGRLPAWIRPLSYDLHITTDPDQGTFSGKLAIELQLDRSTSELTLHSQGLTIESADLGGQPIDVKALTADKAMETVTFPLPSPAGPGKAVLALSYSGKLGQQMKGLYLSRAKHKGKMENYAFTHFEPTDAREMLPCFDEPNFKAVFRLTLTAPERLTLLSNMPAEKETVLDGMKTARFAPTPKMSTYLVALAAARLKPNSRVVEDTQVTVWTRPEDTCQGVYALEAAEECLKRLNAYFALPYDLPKIDLVAVPDFAAGAMENWGAIFFRDSALLFDKVLSSPRARRRVAEVVAHELVHQWFGNLVTMKWWNDLWLNEAFATWLSYKIVDDWQPEYAMWLDFEDRRQAPLAIDALKSTRPISSQAVGSAEIRAQFDALSYSKGGSVLHMIEAFVGEEAFREGMRLYMRRHKYANTEAADLWNALAEASGRPIGRIVQRWLNDPGYPNVNVALADKDKRTLKLTQSRFKADGKPDPENKPWPVPMVLRYKAGGKPQEHRVLLEKPEETVALPGQGPLEWVYPNGGEKGFYRVSLEESLRAALGKDPKNLDPIERAGLLGHLWARARSGAGPLEAALDTLRDFKDDHARNVTEATTGYLRALERLLDEKDRPAFIPYVRDLLDARFKRLGFTGPKDDETALARAAVLGALLRLAPKPEEEAEAEKHLKTLLEHPDQVEPTLAGPLLAFGARKGATERFEQFRKHMVDATTPEERDRFLLALTQFRKPDIIQKFLDLLLAEDIRPQDLWKPFGALLRNPEAWEPTWKFVRERWQDLRQKGGDIAAQRIIECLSALDHATAAEEVRNFFADPKNQEPTATRSLAQTLEFIENAARVRTVQSKALGDWLSANYN